MSCFEIKNMCVITKGGDKMFDVLMGDVVEPRKRFIEDNALNVQNLDV